MQQIFIVNDKYYYIEKIDYNSVFTSSIVEPVSMDNCSIGNIIFCVHNTILQRFFNYFCS